jgi:hypothetical protein
VAPAWGQPQRLLLHELVLTHTDHEVLLHIDLQGVQQEILEAIATGIPITVTYDMRLYRKLGLWFDEEVLSKTIKTYCQIRRLEKAVQRQ